MRLRRWHRGERAAHLEDLALVGEEQGSMGWTWFEALRFLRSKRPLHRAEAAALKRGWRRGRNDWLKSSGWLLHHRRDGVYIGPTKSSAPEYFKFVPFSTEQEAIDLLKKIRIRSSVHVYDSNSQTA